MPTVLRAHSNMGHSSKPNSVTLSQKGEVCVKLGDDKCIEPIGECMDKNSFLIPLYAKQRTLRIKGKLVGLRFAPKS